jgi:hypothetical protein
MSVTREQPTSNLFLLEDLGDLARAKELAASDLDALRSVADWIESYVAKPHRELIGRDGPVCPFVPGALERKRLWLAPERVADAGASQVIDLMNGYQRRLLEAAPVDAAGVNYDVIVVVFTDLPAERAKGLFADVVQQIALPSYEQRSLMFGPFYEGNEGTALYNPGFRAFESPVPFLFVRHGVVGDWKFFLDSEEWIRLWAHRYRESGAEALAEELRHLAWRTARD